MLQYLQIHFFDNFFLSCPDLGIMIQTRSGIDFENPIFTGLLADVAINDEIDATEPETHVASELDCNLSEFRVYRLGNVDGVATG